MTESNGYITIKEAAEIRQASEEEIRELINKEKLRNVQINRHEVEALPQSELPGLHYRINGEVIAPFYPKN
jgi:hypothetical protein